MRVSTSLFYTNGVRTMNTQQSDLMRLMQQLGTGKKILTPSDDPLGAAQALNLGQTSAMNTRMASNRAAARQSLLMEETQLNTVNRTLQDVRTRIVEAGNGTYSETELRTLAQDLKAHYDLLLSTANSTDGSGQYLFSGNRGNVAPYEISAGTGLRSGTYQGDDGQRLVQADATRQLSSGDRATDIFERGNPGAQGYVASSAMGNGGSVVVGRPNITDPAGTLVGSNLVVTFGAEQPGPPPTFDYTVSVNGTNVPSLAGSYDPAAGAQMTLGGVSFTLAGTPATNDTINLAPFSSGHFTLADPANAGDVAVGRPIITDPAGPLVDSDLVVRFINENVGPPVTFDYIVEVNGTADPSLAGSYDPSTGDSLDLGGVSFTLEGTPVVGDSVSAGPVEGTDMDMFRTLENLIDALNSADATDPAAKARITNMLNEANRKISNNHDNVLTVRASVGTRLNELDALDVGGAQLGLSYAQELIRIEDVDYREAISQLALRSMALEAAQGAFMKIQGLSLFSR